MGAAALRSEFQRSSAPATIFGWLPLASSLIRDDALSSDGDDEVWRDGDDPPLDSNSDDDAPMMGWM